MHRDEVFKASGPTSGSAMRVKIGHLSFEPVCMGDVIGIHAGHIAASGHIQPVIERRRQPRVLIQTRQPDTVISL